jgi:hypothetical protein
VPTKRVKIRPTAIRRTPEWVVRYLATGEEPPEGTPERDEYDRWSLTAGTEVPGLPLANSPEGEKLWRRWPEEET